jgi:3-phosphoshikimate 1-carboxyvinyltransferase
MALPELIEIVPLAAPVRAEITVPGSKSITNRALILAALADGEVTLKGALWSEDTQIMVACLKQLGFLVSVAPDPDEACNRTIMVIGEGGLVPSGGTETQPLDLFVGNAGTAARFLAPLLCLGSGVYRLHGVARMHERPQAALFQALRELGYRVESEFHNDKLPARIFAGTAGELPQSQTEFVARKSAPAAPRKCRVSIAESSQFASALLLSSRIGGWEIEIVGENAEESPYVELTKQICEHFSRGEQAMKNNSDSPRWHFPIDSDYSSQSYFWAAEFLTGNSITRWPTASPVGFQIDANFYKYKKLPQFVSRKMDLGDSIMTAIVIAPFAGYQVKFVDLAPLRVQECERVVALRTELTKCGAKVVEDGDTLTVWPSPLHGAEIETYNDHRMAMCFAILGLKVPGIKIKNPACVKKTFPNFFQKLAAQPPHGLGAEIWEIKNGLRIRKLSGEDLFAN